ncbi:MAG: rRNA ((966)-N(2))-methyltransferase RsmD [Belnapia sp.]|nr:rRNA ((966)-N(2))-methyltransferase RsmD [Belnapia sp.]
MRIIAGSHRGRRLLAPAGDRTRPTAERVRQALFDMLWHAPWAGRERIEGVRVLDAFAGTGALGLEALSRGAGQVSFLETDRAALAAIRTNIATCREEARCALLPVDALKPPRAPAPCGLVFLDPPYQDGVMEAALAALGAAGWIAADALICAEYAAGAPAAAPPGFTLLAERAHGAAHLLVLRPGVPLGAPLGAPG